MPAVPAARPLAHLVVLPLLAALVLATLLAAAPADAATRRDRAVNIGLAQRGDDYRYGAEGPHRFDCSGLIYYSYRRAGFGGMPRTSNAQAAWLGKVRKRNMVRGDLMYFFSGGRVYHAGIFLRWKGGRALMLDAGSSGGEVRVRRPWTRSWVGRTTRWH